MTHIQVDYEPLYYKWLLMVNREGQSWSYFLFKVILQLHLEWLSKIMKTSVTTAGLQTQTETS
jgi:hypothetical protein